MFTPPRRSRGHHIRTYDPKIATAVEDGRDLARGVGQMTRRTQRVVVVVPRLVPPALADQPAVRAGFMVVHHGRLPVLILFHDHRVVEFVPDVVGDWHLKSPS